MTKLFQKKSDEEKRSKRLPVLMTEKEFAQIKHLAGIRKLDVSDFMRRSALGRRADVDHETDIVLALSDCTRAIRALHAAFVEKGVKPPEEALMPVILDARAAMLRISR